MSPLKISLALCFIANTALATGYKTPQAAVQAHAAKSLQTTPKQVTVGLVQQFRWNGKLVRQYTASNSKGAVLTQTDVVKKAGRYHILPSNPNGPESGNWD